jgi:hypothetical protein
VTSLFGTNLELPGINTEVYEFTASPNFLQAMNYMFQPVEVEATNAEIEASTKIIKFSDIENPLNTSCPISLERFNANDNVMMIIHCKHIFRRSDLSHWLRSHGLCPVCRFDIRSQQTA